MAMVSFCCLTTYHASCYMPFTGGLQPDFHAGIEDEAFERGVDVAELGMGYGAVVDGVEARLAAVGEVFEVGEHGEFLPDFLHHQAEHGVGLALAAVAKLLLAVVV